MFRKNNILCHSFTELKTIFVRISPGPWVCSELLIFPWRSVRDHWRETDSVPDFGPPETSLELLIIQNCVYWFDFDYMMLKWYRIMSWPVMKWSIWPASGLLTALSTVVLMPLVVTVSKPPRNWKIQFSTFFWSLKAGLMIVTEGLIVALVC